MKLLPERRPIDWKLKLRGRDIKYISKKLKPLLLRLKGLGLRRKLLLPKLIEYD